MVNNCVGLTKQLLGLNSWAVTPQQLHRHLILKKGRPMRINLTLAGFGGGGSGKNPLASPTGMAGSLITAMPQIRKTKPTPTPPPKTPAQAGAVRTGAENIRNTGGGRGMDIASTTSRALKQLTGQ
jgi:hypothetical protein